jgi:transketolase C-terminal domain/subunit
VTVVGVGGGYSYGANGATDHALEDIAIMRCLPNMTVVCPGDPVEAELATHGAIETRRANSALWGAGGRCRCVDLASASGRHVR